ncbi:MAG: hypothetical protein J7J76_06615 [Candidatus Latescibacteria bacterium]|nr:hypothetical protein [Candidatus Latescibacterota bacterium]
MESRSQIEAIAAEFPRYGSRRTMAELGRRGHKIDDKQSYARWQRQTSLWKSNDSAELPKVATHSHHIST